MTESERIKRNKELVNSEIESVNASNQNMRTYHNVSTTFEPLKKIVVKVDKDSQRVLINQIFNDEQNQRTFASGSKRDANDDKPRISDMQPYTLKRFGYHMLIGSKNYGEGNFELGQPTKTVLDSLLRHVNEYRLGDRSEDHLSAILFNAMMVTMNEDREGLSADHFYQLWKDSPKYQEWLRKEAAKRDEMMEALK